MDDALDLTRHGTHVCRLTQAHASNELQQKLAEAARDPEIPARSAKKAAGLLKR